MNKAYIINKMIGNAAYGDYIPDKIKPMSLSRDFLLTVIYFINIIFYIANSFRGPKPLQAALCNIKRRNRQEKQ